MGQDGRTREQAQIRRHCWPDGGGWLEQEVLMEEVFNVISTQWLRTRRGMTV